MPTREELRQLFSRGPLPRRGSAPPPAPAAAPRQTLKPPPEGYAYVQDPVHGFVLVQIAMPAAPGAAPPTRSRLVGPDGQPAAPQRGPAMQRSAQLLRPGIDPATHAPVDKYAEWLSQQPDLAATPERMALIRELVPDVSIMENYSPPAPLVPDIATNSRPDPSADAWGSRKPTLLVSNLGD